MCIRDREDAIRYRYATLVSSSTSEAKAPVQTASMPLDAFDTSWNEYCSGQLNLLIEQLTPLRNIQSTGHCLIDQVQCEDNWILYVWTSLFKIQSDYYQIKWRMYYNTDSNLSWMEYAKVVGNLDQEGTLFNEARAVEFSTNTPIETFTSDPVPHSNTSCVHRFESGLLIFALCLLVVAVMLQLYKRR